MKKKLLVAVLAATAAICGAFGLSACGDKNDGKNNSAEWGSEYSVQSAYALAKDLGYTGTLEEFIATISGKDGKDGVGIDNAYIDEEGCLILVLTDKTTINCGKVSVSSVDKQDFQYATVKENNQTVGYSIIGIKTGTVVDTDLVIPSSYQGKPVKEIAKEAFKDNKHFTSVTIPESVTTIGNSAFSGCTDLVTVDISRGVTTIEGLAFFNCNSIAEIRYAGDMTSWCGISGLSGLMSNGTKDRKLFINNAEIKGNLVIPNSVTSIGDGAFCGCSSLTRVTIPNGVTEIGSSAFCDCSSLANVTIPNSVTEIGSSAFCDCSSLANVMIPNSVTKIGSSAFSGCTSFTNVTIPAGVTEVGGGAFGSCTSLESATIPTTAISAIYTKKLRTLILTGSGSIGDYAFSRCDLLTSITIPDGVTEIGSNAFYGCKALTSVTIPGSVVSIGNNVFEDCTSLASVLVESGVTKIGSYMFKDCTSLTNVTLPNSITTIGKFAFWNCYSLTSIILPNSVTYIDLYAFSSCSALTIYCEAVKRPDQWGDYWNDSYCPVVWNCKNNEVADNGYIYFISNGLRYALKDGEATVAEQARTLSGAVVIPKSVTYKGTTYSVTKIDYDAFRNISVTSLTIPESMTKIDGISYCTSLTNVIIPDSVIEIAYGAFEGCSGLINITYKGTKKQWNEIEKEYNWDYRTGEYTVHCTDGDIAKS